MRPCHNCGKDCACLAVGEPSRDVLRAALIKSFPLDDVETLLKTVRWSAIDTCWIMPYAGMTVGIETDGYVHS